MKKLLYATTTGQFDMNRDEMPYWCVLLQHFENKGYIHNGLTIPFLIGAREQIKPTENNLTIDELMVSISEHGGTILYCSNIGEFVIGTLDSETLKYKSIYPDIVGNIIITDNSLNMVKNLEQLIENFEERYQKYIDKGEYSKNSGVWGGFTEIELTRINEIK